MPVPDNEFAIYEVSRPCVVFDDLVTFLGVTVSVHYAKEVEQ